LMTPQEDQQQIISGAQQRYYFRNDNDIKQKRGRV
jgi:hypothetical protein